MTAAGAFAVLASCLLPFAWTATLSGVVKSADGQPVAGAAVSIDQAGRTLSATTDASGAFSIADVELPVTIEVSARGFRTTRQHVTASPVEIALPLATVRESIVVSALSRSDATQPGLDPVAGGIALPRAFLDQVPSVTPDEAIRVVSGFSLFRRSSSRASNPTTHGVTMRGLSASGSSRGLVMLDGVPLNEGFGGWVTWTRLPSTAIGEVDMQRGAQGDVFGSDALGGVIDIMAPALRNPFARISVEGGSQGTASTELSAGRRFGRVVAFGAASWFSTDGTIPVAPESRGAVDQPAEADWFNGYGRVAATWGTQQLVFAGWGGRDTRGNGTVVQRNRMSGGTFAVTFDGETASTRIAARLSVSPNDFYQTFSQVGAGRATETLTSTQFTDIRATRAMVEVGRPMAATGYIVGRVASTRASSDFSDVRPNPAQSTSRALVDDSDAVSLQAGFAPAGGFTVGAGVRTEWRSAPTESDGRDDATVGRLTWSWKIAAPLVLRGSAATSHRWPTLNELVRPFQAGAVLTQANPDLKPERARAADVAATFVFQRATITTAGFWSVVEDAIANVTITPTLRQRRNAGNAHATGAEVDAGVRAHSRLWLRGSLTFADSTFRDSAEAALEGKRLPQVPRVSFSFSAMASLPRAIDASVVWRDLSEQFDDDRNVFEMAVARQLDFRVAGRLREFGWQVSFENALNARVEVGKGPPVAAPLVTLAPGRAFRVGVSWRR